ncbi:MAG: hypothetical protein AAF318_17700 [Pseudomonadota bacterium]
MIRSLFFAAFAAGLMSLAAGQLLDAEDTSPPKPIVPGTLSETRVSTDDTQLVCRAAVAAMFHRPLNDVRAAPEADYVRTSYVKEGVRYPTACQVRGLRVRWASIFADGVGRWRDHALDEKVYFRLSSKGVTIRQVFSDGTELRENFPRG